MDNPTLYDKPFKTYDELIELMRSRNIIVEQPEFAKSVLSSLSYYTIINGYKNTFLSIPGSDKFIDGTHFEDLYSLHLIDININNIILKNILLIERFLKTRLSYTISRKYGVFTDLNDLRNMNSDDYLCRANYSSRNHSGRNATLSKIKRSVSLDHTSESLSYYINTKNHVPAWIMVSGISFGLSIRWYEILKGTDKAEVCEQFITSTALSIDEKKEFLTIAFNLLREYRNKIAHGNRTFNTSNLPVLPKHPLMILCYNSLSEKEYNQGYGKSDLFAIILLCFILISDPYILKQFFDDLQYILLPYQSQGIKMNGKSILEIFGLPENFFERLTNLLNARFS